MGFDENNGNSFNFLGFEETKPGIGSLNIKKEDSENEDLGRMWGSNSYRLNECEFYQSPRKVGKNVESITPFTSDKKPKGGRSAKGKINH